MAVMNEYGGILSGIVWYQTIEYNCQVQIGEMRKIFQKILVFLIMNKFVNDLRLHIIQTGEKGCVYILRETVLPVK